MSQQPPPPPPNPDQPQGPYQQGPYPQGPYQQGPYQQGPYQQGPYQQAPKRSNKTLWIVLGIIFGVMILTCGGCLAVTGAFFNEVDNAIDEHENQEGGTNNPITLSEGDAFTIGDNEYQSGWTLTNGALGDADVENLSVTNTGNENDYPSITFEMWDGSTLLASVDCGLLEEVVAGTTQKLDCYGEEPLPNQYEKLTVRNSL